MDSWIGLASFISSGKELNRVFVSVEHNLYGSGGMERVNVVAVDSSRSDPSGCTSYVADKVQVQSAAH